MDFTPEKCADTQSLNTVLRVTHLPLKPVHKLRLKMLVLDFGSSLLMPSLPSHARIITQASDLIFKEVIIIQFYPSPLLQNLPLPCVLYFH